MRVLILTGESIEQARINEKWRTRKEPLISPPIIDEWARKLVDLELDSYPSLAQTELATLRAYEKLRRQLCVPVRVDAFRALASRALSSAKSQHPNPNTLEVTTTGALRGLDEIKFPFGPDEDDRAGIILIPQLFGLALTFLAKRQRFVS